MRLILLSLTLVTIFATAFASAPRPGSADSAAWREACELSRYNCKGIHPPAVRESMIVEAADLYGLYFGGNTVWLRVGLPPNLRYAVTVHEMVHFLQAKVDGKGPPFGSQLETCLREEEAYEISDRVTTRLGIAGKMHNADKLRANCTAE